MTTAAVAAKAKKTYQPRDPCEITIPVAHQIIDAMASRGVTWSTIERRCQIAPGNMKKAWHGDKPLTRRQFQAVMRFLGLD